MSLVIRTPAEVKALVQRQTAQENERVRAEHAQRMASDPAYRHVSLRREMKLARAAVERLEGRLVTRRKQLAEDAESIQQMRDRLADARARDHRFIESCETKLAGAVLRFRDTELAINEDAKSLERARAELVELEEKINECA
jgi:hypothetical protein